jgi:hypothetical protein
MLIPNLIAPHKSHCESVGDMWRFHNAVAEYFSDHCGMLTAEEAFVLGQLYACGSFEEAYFIYAEYLYDLAKQPELPEE